MTPIIGTPRSLPAFELIPCPFAQTARVDGERLAETELHTEISDECQTYAVGAAPIGVPGWPELAFSIASMAKVPIAFIAT
jgi:hypothetical protein